MPKWHILGQLHSLFKIKFIKPYSGRCFAKFWNSGSRFYLPIRFYCETFKKCQYLILATEILMQLVEVALGQCLFKKLSRVVASVENYCSRVVAF